MASISSKTGKVLQIIFLSRHYTIILNYIWTLSGLHSMIASLEESQSQREVSCALCTTPSKTLNIRLSAGHRGKFDISVTKKPAEDNVLARLNVALQFLLS